MAQEFFNYIGGKLIASENKSFLTKHNPFDGTALGTVASSEAMDVVKALPLAKNAFAAYEKTSLPERAQLLLKMAAVLEEKKDEYSLLEALHQGLLKSFVLEHSVSAAIDSFRQAAQQCQNAEQGMAARPVGIVSIITSWCLSLKLVCERLAPALAAGNAVLIKVSEHSPVTAHILAEVCDKAGVPQGLVQIFQGQGAAAGGLLAAHPSVRAVCFAGRMNHAESVIRAATPQFKKVQISAGAKNSAFVLNEFSWESQIPRIMRSFLLGQGQMCWNSHRLFIPESIRENFVEAVRAYFQEISPATDPSSTSLWTPLIDSQAVGRMSEKNQQAQQEHAKLILAANPGQGPGFFASPVMTLDLTNCSVLQQDEVGAPLFVLTSVKYQHEMVKWANTGYYGHSAVIWGEPEKAMKMANSLQCSQVWVNGWLQTKEMILGQKQSSFGNLDPLALGGFYSDVKKVSV